MTDQSNPTYLEEEQTLEVNNLEEKGFILAPDFGICSSVVNSSMVRA